MMAFEICGIRTEPGERYQGYIAGPDGVKNIPIVIVNGRQEGSTVLLTAGVHACEYPGAAALMELMVQLTPEQVRGQLVMLPMLNMDSFFDRIPFVVKRDGKNLNREFPGDPQGSFCQQLADLVHRELHAKADYYIDIHSGDVCEMVTPFVYYPVNTAPEVTAQAVRMCQAMRVPYRAASRSTNGSYGSAAAAGVPSILIEQGGRCGYTLAERDAYLADLRSILVELGTLEGELRFNAEQTDVTRSFYIDVEADGCWKPMVGAGDRFHRGDLLGIVTDFFGKELQRVTAECDGVVLYLTVSLAVRADEPLIAYGEVL